MIARVQSYALSGLEGVCVMVDDKFFSVTPDTVGAFFRENVLAKL